METSKKNFMRMTKLPYAGQWVCLHLLNAPNDRFYDAQSFSLYIRKGAFDAALSQKCSVGAWSLSPQGRQHWAQIYRRIANGRETALLG